MKLCECYCYAFLRVIVVCVAGGRDEAPEGSSGDYAEQAARVGGSWFRLLVLRRDGGKARVISPCVGLVPRRRGSRVLVSNTCRSGASCDCILVSCSGSAQISSRIEGICMR